LCLSGCLVFLRKIKYRKEHFGGRAAKILRQKKHIGGTAANVLLTETKKLFGGYAAAKELFLWLLVEQIHDATTVVDIAAAL
jgi:hypothetical protein